jgi:hypothetical protein
VLEKELELIIWNVNKKGAESNQLLSEVRLQVELAF